MDGTELFDFKSVFSFRNQNSHDMKIFVYALDKADQKYFRTDVNNATYNCSLVCLSAYTFIVSFMITQKTLY